MMATEKQIAANKANAKRSTGPRTQAGKSRSSTNARKHALLAKAIVVDGEDPAEFEDLLRSLVEEFDPNPGCEHELVSLLATDFWRLRRIPRLEARSLSAQQSEIVYRDPRVDLLIEDEVLRSKRMGEIVARYLPKSSGPTDESTNPSGSTDEDDEKRIRARFDKLLPPEASQPLLSPSESQDLLAKISRYETALRNSISRTLNTLIGLQNMRTERAERRRLKLVHHQGVS